MAILGLLVNPEGLCAQEVPSGAPTEELWTQIESMLEGEQNFEAFENILQVVRDHCGSDYSCLFNNYNFIQSNLERIFNIPAALYVGEELIKITHKENEFEAEGQAHLDQYRFYDASGDRRLSNM